MSSALATIAACAPAYDPVRVAVDEGTLGRRIVTLMCKRLAFQADPTDVSGDRYREHDDIAITPKGPDPAADAGARPARGRDGQRRPRSLELPARRPAVLDPVLTGAAQRSIHPVARACSRILRSSSASTGSSSSQ